MVKNVLLIDDDYDDHLFFESILDELELGISLVTAENGISGLKYLKETQNLPDLIFLDLNMPQMGGFDFLKILKEEEKLKNIAVVIYTTSNNHFDIEKSRESGANMFFSKPSNLIFLSEKLKQIFSKKLNSNHTFQLVQK